MDEEAIVVEKPLEEEAVITIALAPVEYADIRLIRSWENDYKVWKWFGQNDFCSDFQYQKRYEKNAEDPTKKYYKFLISKQPVGEEELKIFPFGLACLSNICHINRRAEIRCLLAPAFLGRDLEEKALCTTLSHCFENLNFHVLWMNIFEGDPLIPLYEKMGFRREGIRRDFVLRDKKFIDVHLFSIKETEWKG